MVITKFDQQVAEEGKTILLLILYSLNIIKIKWPYFKGQTRNFNFEKTSKFLKQLRNWKDNHTGDESRSENMKLSCYDHDSDSDNLPMLNCGEYIFIFIFPYQSFLTARGMKIFRSKYINHHLGHYVGGTQSPHKSNNFLDIFSSSSLVLVVGWCVFLVCDAGLTVV